MGARLGLVMESNRYLAGDCFFVDCRCGSQVKVKDDYAPLGFPESSFYLGSQVFFGSGSRFGDREFFLSRRRLLGGGKAKVESGIRSGGSSGGLAEVDER